MKGRRAHKPKVETNRITGLKLPARDSGDPGSPAVAVEASIRPKERLNLIHATMERDLASQKERDHGYEDVVEVRLQAVHSSSAYLFVLECSSESTPNISISATSLEGIFSSSRLSAPSPNVADEEAECVRYVRHRITRLGNAAIDRRDAFIQRYGIHDDDSTFTRRRQAFVRRMDAIIPEDDEEMSARLRERWRFDQDDEPTVGPEGADEQQNQDHQALTTDNTIVVTVDGRQHCLPILPWGATPVQRSSRSIWHPAGIPMPNGVPISMQARVKAMHPPSTIPQMRISSNGAMRPPVAGNIASPSSPTVLQQSSPPRAASTNGVNETMLALLRQMAIQSG
ncbi:hypothetical protein CY34DRAFT_19302 [Suillus luteus UH-Slu-Lm8-n1]|uniref:Uncharacterized protein n=1 Tax=Suillus luteus UH-Slu-Lm8-n1 TaxID=930992 RepID=A0A0D0AJH5_9AGAM|nr:hypothetical protein CY34DRAFT_19302 [Suillus luteus UH-Slu-Lm8-n1]